MDIQKDELQSVFKLLDRDGSGSVSYMEFCEELHKIRTRDTRTMLTFLKLQVNETRESVDTGRVASEERLTQQNEKLDAHTELLELIFARLEKLGSLEVVAAAPPSGTSAWAQQ
eukprot:3207280-Heterocapsa_arctica.AAC.1